MEILCFAAGMLFFYNKNIFLYLFLLMSLIFRPKITIILAFILALFWGWAHNYLLSSKSSVNFFDGQVVKMDGRIISTPKVSDIKTQFVLQPVSSSPILVNCFKNCANIRINQIIQTEVKLRKPRNFLNPGGFDYVGFLNARHIYWLGSCKDITILSDNFKAKHFTSIIRDKLRNKVDSIDIENKPRALIEALTIGFTNNLSEEDWKLFRRTGTIHLLVISGAHIGFVSGFVFFIANFLWSRSSLLCLRLPSIVFASVCAIFFAFIYSVLAGFGSSVQRAFIASFFVFSRNILKLKFTNWQIWRIGLVSCLIYEPHYVLYPGFFLSFFAVAIIFIINQYVKLKTVSKTIIIQLSCLVGLLPFTLYWFNYASLNGFLANLISIPLVGFCIVPLALLFLICSMWGSVFWLTNFLSKLIDLLYWYLNYIDKISNFNLELYLPIYATFCLLMLLGIALLYPVKSLKLAFFGVLLIFILPKSNKLKANAAQINVLDVGQGLAVLVRTAKHNLLYDTGGKFYRGKDLGELVILPYLQTLYRKNLDMIIVSHPDLDHRGGLATIEKDLVVKKLVVNNPEYYKRGFNCHDYPKWEWDGVSFEFLSIEKKFRKKNNDSCVLMIKTKNSSILLPGDIEHEAENYLVNKYHKRLAADYLVVPHHGSKTSSSKVFLQIVKPKYAIFSYGFKNRYHFPSQTVIARYNALRAKTFNTASHGMLTFII
jgi:competence protein ComEC